MADENTYNFTIRRSDNEPSLAWAWQQVDASDTPLWEDVGKTIPTLIDLTGSEFVLTIRGPGVAFVLRSADDEISIGADDFVVWEITEAQARHFPKGKPATYELQRLIAGTKQVLAEGTITGIGGLSNG